MNIFTYQNVVGARVFAVMTAASMILSALPVHFFSAQAEVSGHNMEVPDNGAAVPQVALAPSVSVPDVTFCHVDDIDGPNGPFEQMTLSPSVLEAQGHANPGVFDIIPPYIGNSTGVNWPVDSQEQADMQLFIDNGCVEITESSEVVVVKADDLAQDITDVIADPLSWFFYNDETDTIDSALGSFVFGPDVVTMGEGSAEITVSGAQRRNLATYQFSGVALADITQLSFETYNPSASNGGGSDRSAYINFNIDFDGSDTWQKRIAFVPNKNGSPSQDTWEQWDAIDGGSALWWWSGYADNANQWPDGDTNEYRTWNNLLVSFPGISVRTNDPWFGFRVGEPYADGYTENIDAFVIAINEGTNIHTTSFDFEPDPVLGCTDPEASNYDLNATEDDGSCEFVVPVCKIGDNLLKNGSFEDPVVTAHNGDWEVFSSIPEWTSNIVANGIELQNGLFGGASDGAQHAELDVKESTELSQTVSTIAGGTYELQFDFSARSANDADNSIEASADGVVLVSMSTDDTDWVTYSGTFVADDSTDIMFADKGISNGTGTLLDNAVLCLVKEPEPDPWCAFEGKVIAHTPDADAKTNGGALVNADRRHIAAVETVAPYQNIGGKEGNDWQVSPLDFFSLGIEGYLVYEFTDAVAFNQVGADIAVYEITGGSPAQETDEVIEVSVSQDGITYTSLGEFTGDAEIDISPAGLDFVKFVRLDDKSSGVQGSAGDGYDVDAIVILEGSCGDEPEKQYAPYCGDGIVGSEVLDGIQDWEQCEIGDVGCTAQCQLAEQNQCTDLTLAKIEMANVSNKDGGVGDMTDGIFLGQGALPIPNDVWFRVFQNDVYDIDTDLASYEDVPGLAVQRLAGSLRTVMHGTATQADEEHADGTIKFWSWDDSVEAEDIVSDTSDGAPGNNKLENPFNSTQGNPGDDEVSIENGEVLFWLSTDIADDGFYTEYSTPIDCRVDSFSIVGNKWNDKNGDGQWNDNEPGIDDWGIALRPMAMNAVEELHVSAESAAVVPSVNILESDHTYIVEVTGTYSFGNRDDYVADAEWSHRNDSYTDNPLASHGWTLGENTYPSIVGLDLQIDGENINWGSFNEDHLYKTVVVGDGSVLEFSIHDSAYGDNTGGLDVAIYDVTEYLAQTDNTGRYQFDVPEGEYQVVEIMQEGWTQTYPVEPSYYHVMLPNKDDVEYDFGNKQDNPPDIYGCTDPSSPDYDIDANIDDQSCTYPLVCEAGVNLVANPSFETPVVDGQWDAFESGATGVEWLVEWVSDFAGAPAVALLEIQRNVEGWLASDGDQYAELDADWLDKGDEAYDEQASVMISQVIDTIPGEEYTLSWDFSPRPNTFSVDNDLEVFVEGVQTANDNSGAGGAENEWLSDTYTFVATQEETTVAFADGGEANAVGTFLDNVALTCNPAPEAQNYCGDQVQNQEWEQCDGVEGCTNYCTWANQCTDLQLVKITLDEKSPASVSFDGSIYLGSDTNPIPNGTWFNFDEGGDTGAQFIANNTQGLGVERNQDDGTLNLAFVGGNDSKQNDYVIGSVETVGIELGTPVRSLVPGYELENGTNSFYDVLTRNAVHTALAFDLRADVGNDGAKVAVMALDEPYNCPALYTIEGYVWHDDNENEVWDGFAEENPTEDPQADWKVHITNGIDTFSTETDQNGYYYFMVPAGTWTLTEDVQSGWSQIFPNNGTHVVTVPAVLASADETTLFAAVMNYIIPTVHAVALEAFKTTYGDYNFGNNEVNGPTPTFTTGGGSGGHRLSSSRNVGDTEPELSGIPSVLGEQVSIVPNGAPDAGAGGASSLPVAIAYTINPVAFVGRRIINNA